MLNLVMLNCITFNLIYKPLYLGKLKVFYTFLHTEIVDNLTLLLLINRANIEHL